MTNISKLLLKGNTPSRVVLSLILGAFITFGLFAIMHALIQNDHIALETPDPIPNINVVYQEKEDITRQITRVPQPPKTIEPPKRLPPAVTNDTNKIDVPGIGPIDTTPTITTEFKESFGFAERSATPMVRVPPKYPIVAAQKGIEGWVELSFSIDTKGEVIDVMVINSEPKRIFDREAKRALKRWKYKPKVESGKAIVQSGLTVLLDFKMDA